MKNIFLCSYMFKVKETFKEFIKDFDAREIVFIPTASQTEERRDYVYRAWSFFESLGFKVWDLEVDRVDADECKRMIEKAEILYVAGGNTYYLLQELQKRGLVDLVHKRVEEGMIYLGESAGGVLTSKNVEYVKVIDPLGAAPDIKGFEGFDLVDFYILPHFGEEPFKEVNDKTYERYKDELNILKINNFQAVTIKDGGDPKIITDPSKK